MNAKEFIFNQFEKDGNLKCSWVKAEDLMEAYHRHKMGELLEKVENIDVDSFKHVLIGQGFSKAMKSQLFRIIQNEING
jgi:hypothetical protein